MIDKRYLIPREKPWNVDPKAEPRAELSPEQKGLGESARKILTVNVSQTARRIAGWWKR